MSRLYAVSAFVVAALCAALVGAHDEEGTLVVGADEKEEDTPEVCLLQSGISLHNLVKGKTTSCEGPIDIVFLIDESGSTCGDAQSSMTLWKRQYGNHKCSYYQTRQWNEPVDITYAGQPMPRYMAQREFIKDLVKEFTLGPDDTRIALVGFSNNQLLGNINGARTISGWSTDAAAITAALETTRGMGGTYPDLAFGIATNLLSSGRPQASKFIITILDGTPSSGSRYVNAARAAQQSATVLAIGYGGGAVPSVLGQIASDTSYVISEFDLSAAATMLTSGDTFCSIVCQQASCEVFSDPHVITFDNSERKPPQSLSALTLATEEGLATGATMRSFLRTFDARPLDVNVYKVGDVWLMKSPSLLVQARLRASEDFRLDHSAVAALAVAGKSVGDHKLLVGACDGEVSWNGQVVPLGNFTFQYPGGNVVLAHRENSGSEQPRKRLEANFSSGFHVLVQRYAHHLDVKLTTRPLPGGVDGECGNFNRLGSDDAQQDLDKRLSKLEMHNEERLIPANM